MQINEVSKLAGLTKKAVDYYVLHGLVAPAVLDNGYREYSEQDVEILLKIGTLRKLDVSIEEIRAILNDPTCETIHTVVVRKELDFKRDKLKKEILNKLSLGESYSEISTEIQAIETSKTIAEKLLDAFPGYYGRLVCLHFARFLNEPIKSQAQQDAYDTIISFLDSVPQPDIPSDLQEYLIEGTGHIGAEQMVTMLEATKKSFENPEKFLSDNKDVIEWYLSYKQSEEYKNSLPGRLMMLMQRFNSTSGYNDIFIPAMKRLSSAYCEYHRHIETANEKFLTQYPEIEGLSIKE